MCKKISDKALKLSVIVSLQLGQASVEDSCQKILKKNTSNAKVYKINQFSDCLLFCLAIWFYVLGRCNPGDLQIHSSLLW